MLDPVRLMGRLTFVERPWRRAPSKRRAAVGANRRRLSRLRRTRLLRFGLVAAGVTVTASLFISTFFDTDFHQAGCRNVVSLIGARRSDLGSRARAIPPRTAARLVFYLLARIRGFHRPEIRVTLFPDRWFRLF